MQAITTKYFGPGNVKGSRVKASCQAKSKTLDWSDNLNSAENHTLAAKTLATELGWKGKWIAGHLYDGTTVFVCDSGFHDETFTVNGGNNA